MKRNTAVWLAWLLAGLPALVWTAQAATNEKEVEEDQSLASQLVTPHKPWAKGYSKGAPRALFIVTPGNYDGSWFAPETRMREVVELIQRFDLNADAFFFGGSKGEDFFGLELGRARAERLLEKPYDVYVVAGTNMDKLPPKFQYMIMEQVAKGAGLVCVGPAAKDFMTDKRRVQPVPGFLVDGVPALDGKQPGELVSAYRLGKGRGAWLNYPAWVLTPRGEFSWAGLAAYDYRMLWVGRAVLWAASRESKVTAAFQAAEGQGGLPTLTLNVSNADTQALALSGTVEIRRASDGWITPGGAVSATVSAAQPLSQAITLTPLRAGQYFVDVVLKSAAGVEAFAAGTFEVKSDAGIETVVLDRTYAETGEKIPGKVTLRGTPPAGSLLQIRFRDAYDRVLAQQAIPVAAGRAEYPIEYTPDAFATIWMRAEAALVAGGLELEMKDASFTVPKRRQGQFNFLQWDTPNDVLGLFAWQQMKKAGMSTCLIGSFNESKFHPVLAAADIPMVPYSTRILDPKDDNGVMKVRDKNGNFQALCWNDEPKIDEYVQTIVDYQKKRREHGVFVYSLGDEGVTLGCCVAPTCMAAYRRYLQAQYGTIEALNASWGEQHKSFDEVALLDVKDNMENAAKGKAQWARWYDRQAFARYNLMQFSGRFVKAYEQLDPKGLTGFEGTGGFGDDYDSIVGINPFYGPYPSIGDDIVRSIAPRATIRSNWMGYSKTGDALSDAAWRMVIKGMDSVWYWMWTGIGSWRGYITPTLDFYPATADLMQEMQPVCRGLGDLLLQSDMTHSGIAVFYSLPSALSHTVEDSGSFMSPEMTHQTWTRLTYDLGLDFRYLTDAMIRRGALTHAEFKVLLLPMTQAVASDQAAAIRAFVEAGGVVIADVRPGVLDGHCKPLDKGNLDDLFGIRRTNRGKAEKAPVVVSGALDIQTLEADLGKCRIDPGVEAATAKPACQAGKYPVMLVNPVGKGRAILLNFQLLSDQADDAQAAAARKFLGALYGNVGVKAAVTATAPDNGPLPETEVRIWNDGDARVFGLWRQMKCAWFSPMSGTDAGAPVAAKVTLPAKQHVYDLRARKYLGEVTQVDTSLRWGRANFFLALPYRIGKPDIDLSTKKPEPGQVVTATIELDIPKSSTARHAVYVDVMDPTGRTTEWGGQVVILDKGRGSVQVPVAFNAMPGKWQIKATELFSNRSADASWKVK
ncbi:MAG: hypothetical protein A3K19_18460 [Lentisphaerae bacterium RIFOXYB12_FULL_65_16]|nr:MAG: hypothetical protein A3K18_13825 [Lentisphaerae bacterium RIFOXYA12_64_32]OGV92945.1 MAG: hypothetical protein A3K19_18460 [Lentisphaerae bacterium RIFOXYB12_FULL_65_16]